MKNKKTMFRIYTLFEYEEEQAFLEEQHRKGWRCTGFKIPGFYSFEKCDPEEATYRIDFADTKCSDETSYRQLFADNGWEFLWAVNGFSIFRKMPGSNGGKEENEIFTDHESKISMMKKIQKRRLLPLVLIFLCLIVPNIIKLFRSNSATWDGGDIALNITWSVVAVLYLCIFTKSFLKIRALKKKYDVK